MKLGFVPVSTLKKKFINVSYGFALLIHYVREGENIYNWDCDKGIFTYITIKYKKNNSYKIDNVLCQRHANEGKYFF